MADQTITVTIPASGNVAAAMGIIMTVEGRVVIGNNTAPLLSSDPKALLMMLEHARNEISKVAPAAPLNSTKGLHRS